MSQSQLKVFCDSKEIDPSSFYKRMTLSRINPSLVKTHEQQILPCEIIHLIFSFNDNGKTHKAILETCKEAHETYKHLIHKYRDIFYTLLKKYPHKSWNMTYLSSNPRVTLNCIRSLYHLHWDYKKIMLNNPNVTLDFALEYQESCDSEVWKHLSKNPNIATIKNFHSVGKFLYSGFSSNPNITFKFIIDTFRKQYVSFDMYEISKNPGITLKDIEDNPTFRWDWYGISLNPNVTQEFVEKNVERLCWHNISQNKSIATQEYVDKTADKLPWDWGVISKNTHMDIVFVEKYCDRLVNHDMIVSKLIKQNMSAPINTTENVSLTNDGWRWLYRSEKFFTTEFLEKHQDKPWNWEHVMLNCEEPLKVMKFLPQNIKKSNSFMHHMHNSISRNPNIMIEDIEDNPDFEWNWKYISGNTFGTKSCP